MSNINIKLTVLILMSTLLALLSCNCLIAQQIPPGVRNVEIRNNIPKFNAYSTVVLSLNKTNGIFDKADEISVFSEVTLTVAISAGANRIGGMTFNVTCDRDNTTPPFISYNPIRTDQNGNRTISLKYKVRKAGEYTIEVKIWREGDPDYDYSSKTYRAFGYSTGAGLGGLLPLSSNPFKEANVLIDIPNTAFSMNLQQVIIAAPQSEEYYGMVKYSYQGTGSLPSIMTKNSKLLMRNAKVKIPNATINNAITVNGECTILSDNPPEEINWECHVLLDDNTYPSSTAAYPVGGTFNAFNGMQF